MLWISQSSSYYTRVSEFLPSCLLQNSRRIVSKCCALLKASLFNTRLCKGLIAKIGYSFTFGGSLNTSTKMRIHWVRISPVMNLFLRVFAGIYSMTVAWSSGSKPAKKSRSGKRVTNDSWVRFRLSLFMADMSLS